MSNEKLVQLIQSGADQDGTCMLQLWEQNRGLIAKIAMKYQAFDNLDDLKQEGYFGLCDAVRCYDPEAGASFAHYAVFWIRQSLQRYIDDCTGSVRIPVHRREDVMRYKRLCADFRKSTGMKPTESEICRFMGVSREVLQRIEESVRMCEIGSIDKSLSEDGEDTIGVLLQGADDVEGSVLDEVQQEQLASTLWPIVDALPGQQGEVIRLRYQHDMTLRQAAERLEKTPERVRQIQAKALRELRKPSRAKHLKPFLDDVYSDGLRGNGIGSFSRSWTSSTERAALKLADRDHTGSRTARF